MKPVRPISVHIKELINRPPLWKMSIAITMIVVLDVLFYKVNNILDGFMNSNRFTENNRPQNLFLGNFHVSFSS